MLGQNPAFLGGGVGGNSSPPWDSLPLQIKMLSDRKRELEHRLSATLEENDLLQGTVEELQDRVLILERQGQDKDLQVLQQAQGQRTGTLCCLVKRTGQRPVPPSESGVCEAQPSISLGSVEIGLSVNPEEMLWYSGLSFHVF